MSKYSFSDIAGVSSWSHILMKVFFAPLIYPVVYVLVNFTRLSPNSITVIGGGFGIVAVVFAVLGKLNLCGLFFLVFFLLDCADGRIARLRGISSPFGALLDMRIDRFVFASAIVGLVYHYTEVGMINEARLTVLFGVMFFYHDIFGMYRPDRDARRASDDAADGDGVGDGGGGCEQLEEESGCCSDGDGSSRLVVRLWEFQKWLAPSQALCLITFFVIGSFAGEYRVWVYVVACVGLLWLFLNRGHVTRFIRKITRVIR